MTMLEKLKTQRDSLLASMEKTATNPSQLWVYQELLYRIEVFEVFQMFSRTAPRTADLKVLCRHYQMADAYIHHQSSERRYGKPADETQKQHREAAANHLQRVIADYRKRMSSFRPATEDLYKTEIGTLFQNVLIVWVQHRNCYVDINKMMEEIETCATQKTAGI